MHAYTVTEMCATLFKMCTVTRANHDVSTSVSAAAKAFKVMAAKHSRAVNGVTLHSNLYSG